MRTRWVVAEWNPAHPRYPQRQVGDTPLNSPVTACWLDRQYRRIKLDNKAIQSRIVSEGGEPALAFLHAAGFARAGESLVYRRADAGLLWVARDVAQQAAATALSC